MRVIEIGEYQGESGPNTTINENGLAILILNVYLWQLESVQFYRH